MKNMLESVLESQHLVMIDGTYVDEYVFENRFGEKNTSEVAFEYEICCAKGTNEDCIFYIRFYGITNEKRTEEDVNIKLTGHFVDDIDNPEMGLFECRDITIIHVPNDECPEMGSV